MAKLDALTNLRVVRDPSSPTGWSEEIVPSTSQPSTRRLARSTSEGSARTRSATA